MQESVFIRQNYAKWRKIEWMVGDRVFTGPDDLVDAYNEITTDLAFAQTQYPDSPVTAYLNDIALGIHRDVHRNRRTRWSSFVKFWIRDIPLAVYEARANLLISLIVFVFFIAVGAVSTLGDPDFPRTCLGDSYMDMTLENIEKGEPMAVYSQGSQIVSFLGITVNNIFVSFITYAMGVLTSFGTGFFLLSNGVMIGAFITFFITQGLFVEAILAIMLHGTLELSAIVIAGGAGITLGNGWLFPGTHTRGRSFVMAAKRSMRILVSTIPIFVVAGFIEGFFTRFTDVGDALRLSVILLSLAFVLFYYVFWPITVHRRAAEES